MTHMTPALEVLIPTISIVLVILASHLSLHRDIGELRERMARVEGFLEALVPAGVSRAPTNQGSRREI